MKKIAAVSILALLICTSAFSAEIRIVLASSQTVYVSIYSNIFSGPKERPFNLAAMLSIRNTDLYNQMTLVSAEYFDNNGKRLKEYVEKEIILPPLASHHFSIKEGDESGGFGANFIVRWKADKEINTPIIEGVMIGTKSGQGISFVGESKVISENTR